MSDRLSLIRESIAMLREKNATDLEVSDIRVHYELDLELIQTIGIAEIDIGDDTYYYQDTFSYKSNDIPEELKDRFVNEAISAFANKINEISNDGRDA